MRHNATAGTSKHVRARFALSGKRMPSKKDRSLLLATRATERLWKETLFTKGTLRRHADEQIVPSFIRVDNAGLLEGLASKFDSWSVPFAFVLHGLVAKSVCLPCHPHPRLDTGLTKATKLSLHRCMAHQHWSALAFWSQSFQKQLDRLQGLNAVASNGLRAPHLNLNSIRQCNESGSNLESLQDC